MPSLNKMFYLYSFKILSLSYKLYEWQNLVIQLTVEHYVDSFISPHKLDI